MTNHYDSFKDTNKEAYDNGAWFKNLADYASDLIQCVNSEGRFIYVNQAWLSTLQYPAEEVDKITLWDIIHPDSMEHCMAAFKQVLSGNDLSGLEAVFVAKDGTSVSVEGSVNVKLDDDGSFVFTRGIFRNITERKKAEEDLLAEQREKTLILENMAELVTFVDPEMRIIWANSKIIERHNWHNINFKGQKCYQLCYGLDQPCPDCAVTVALETEKPASGIHKSPDNRYWQMNSVPVHDQSGNLLGVIDTALEITNLVESKEAIEESELKFRTLTERMNDILWTFDLHLNVTYVTPSVEKALGFTMEELVQQPLEKIMPPESRQLAAERLAEELAIDGERVPGSYITLELDCFHKDGSLRCMETTLSFLRDGLRKPIGIHAISRDITDRKQAEMAINASEQKHREILAAMQEGYYEFDLAGNLVFFNESLCRITGYSKAELAGKNYRKVFTNTIEALYKTFSQVYQTGKPVLAVDWPAVTKDGRNPHLEFSIALRRDQSGAPIGFRGVIRDITVRRQAEEQIRYLSYRDQLTGLYNRHFLEEEMKRLDTDRQIPISIIMADLNGLKLINDTYGHQTGDQVLRQAAAILENACREDDLLARFGGDEFVIYLPRTPEAVAQKICSRIEEACRDEQVNEVPLSLSTGVAAKINAEQNLTVVLKAAEDQLYQNKLTESRSGKSAIVKTLLQTLAAKSYETETHTRNMQKTAQRIGERIGLPESELRRLNLLITLHDIGKINIPEELLNKKGALSVTEWEVLKKHCETGFRIARASEDFAHVAEDILAHHERWDGNGYPQGLKGSTIPLLARITAIADAYEVMSNGRPYKQAMSRSNIVSEFKSSSGTHFDPELVNIFLLLIKAG